MNTIKTTLLLAGLTGLLLVVGGALGGRGGMTIALLVAVVMNFSAYFFSDTIVLKAYRARPVGPAEAPGLYDVVARLAAKANIPMPRLYVIPDPALNAFATGRSPSHAAVAVTEGLLRALSPEELEGVLAHELSHVLNRDTLTSTVAATLAGAISWLAHPFMMMGMNGNRRRGEGTNPLIALILMVVAPLLAAIIKMAISRSREFEADATGAHLVGYPHGLVGALRKLQQAQEVIPLHHADPATAHLFIVNPLTSNGLLGNIFRTHPPLEDRIRRLLSLDQ
jgi:heat shock protein HtpX